MQRLIWLMMMSVMTWTAQPGLAQDNLLENPQFTQWDGDSPAGWTPANNRQQLQHDTQLQGVEAPSALRVNITTAVGGSYGEIRQTVQAPPGRYRFTGMVRSEPGQVALFQLKLRAGSSEGERINTDFGTAEWTAVELEFDLPQGHDNIQVLCRYRQRDRHVGSSAWWTNASLRRIGDLPGQPADAAAAPATGGGWGSPRAMRQRQIDNLRVADAGQDVYVLPEAVGDGSGSDWDNAAAGMGDGALQAALDRVGPGQTLHIGSGDYRGSPTVTVRGGGNAPEAMVSIVGVDTGEGRPTFYGSWTREDPSTGPVFLRLAEAVGYFRVENLQLRDYKGGILTDGRNHYLRIDDFDVTASRDAVVLRGGVDPLNTDARTTDVVISDCEWINYTKRGLRMRDGIEGVRVIRCLADAGGREWAVEPFQMGFALSGIDVEGVVNRDVTYIDCEARNNYHDNGENYWNADGFVAERQNVGVTYINCRAFDNTDGGWDDKSHNPTLINCVAFRNKRNFRVWSVGPATLINCIGGYAAMPGGNGTAAGLHATAGSHVIAINCTFVGNPIGVDADERRESTDLTRVDLVNSLVIATDAAVTEEERASVVSRNSQLHGPDTDAAEPAAFPGADWDGRGPAFDSPVDGIGYHSGR
jgi:hypothetical protein